MGKPMPELTIPHAITGFTSHKMIMNLGSGVLNKILFSVQIYFQMGGTAAFPCTGCKEGEVLGCSGIVLKIILCFILYFI
jgi:hypothetical protein